MEPLDEVRDGLLGQVVQRRVGAHPARVRAAVAVEQSLVVASRRQRHRPLAVAERDDARLAARESLLDHEGGRLGGDGLGGLVERVADRDTLAGRQAIGLDDDAAVAREPHRERESRRRIGLGERPPRAIGTPAASAISRQNALLDSIRAAAREGPNTGIPAVGDGIGDPGGQRRLGPDHDQLDRVRPRRDDHGPRVERIDARHAP